VFSFYSPSLTTIVVALLLVLSLLFGFQLFAETLSESRSTISDRLRRAFGQRFSVEQRLERHGPQARARLRPYVSAAGSTYPPVKLVLLALKQERRLEVYVGDAGGHAKFLRSYPILAASGTLGPKLREGDLQVPEGVYAIELLNPNSRFHLSLRVNYPNQFDRQQAAAEGRTRLGGDIMIHGSNQSIGCIAIGDQAIEDLFVLAADVGLSKITVLISPLDFRNKDMHDSQLAQLPTWLPGLYQDLAARLKGLPMPASS
jgi:hypothetical protein